MTRESEMAVERVARLHGDPAMRFIKDILADRGDARMRAKDARAIARHKSTAATTQSGSWGEELATPGLAGFVNQLIEGTLIGRIGATRIPSNVPIVAPGTGGSAAWVSGGAYKPVAEFAYTLEQLRELTLAIITLHSKDVIRAAGARADNAFRFQLTRALRRTLDLALMDPTQTGSANLQPPSLTATAPNFPASGSDTAAALADIVQLVATATAAGATTGEGVVLIASLANSIALASALGSAVPAMLGDRVRILPSDSAADRVVLVVPSMVLVVGGQDIAFDVSEAATVQMSATPSAGPQNLVSLFQTSSIGLKSELYVNWRALDGGVAYIDGADYGGAVLS